MHTFQVEHAGLMVELMGKRRRWKGNAGGENAHLDQSNSCCVMKTRQRSCCPIQFVEVYAIGSNEHHVEMKIARFGYQFRYEV